MGLFRLLFKTKEPFLGHDICQGTIKPIQRALKFANKFPDKNQLQRFLECLNYVSGILSKLRKLCVPLFQRLQQNPLAYSDQHTHVVRIIQLKIIVMFRYSTSSCIYDSQDRCIRIKIWRNIKIKDRIIS